MNQADKVLKDIEAQSAKSPLIIIGPGRGRLLDEVVAKHKPASVLEIGTLVGYSAIRIGRLLPPGGRVTCVEINPGIAKVAEGNIERAGLSSVIEVKVGRAQKVIPSLPGPFDMVFIDAEKEEYFEYLRLVEGKLRKGSVVVADNVKDHAHRMKEYLDYVRKGGKYSSTYLEPDGPGAADAVEVSVKL